MIESIRISQMFNSNFIYFRWRLCQQNFRILNLLKVYQHQGAWKKYTSIRICK